MQDLTEIEILSYSQFVKNSDKIFFSQLQVRNRKILGLLFGLASNSNLWWNLWLVLFEHLLELLTQ